MTFEKFTWQARRPRSSAHAERGGGSTLANILKSQLATEFKVSNALKLTFQEKMLERAARGGKNTVANILERSALYACYRVLCMSCSECSML